MVKQELFYKAILDNLTGGLISIDHEGLIIYINPMAEKILKIEGKNFLYKNFKIAFTSFPELIAAIDKTMSTGKTARRAEMRIMHADIPIKIGYGTMPVKSKNKILGYYIIFQDISFGN